MRKFIRQKAIFDGKLKEVNSNLWKEEGTTKGSQGAMSSKEEGHTDKSFQGDIDSYIKEQKQVAENFLKKIDCLGNWQMVAGGAPRNWSEGKPATDLDIYCNAVLPNNEKNKIRFLKKFFDKGEFENTRVCKKDYKGVLDPVCDIISGVFQGEIVQLIFVRYKRMHAVLENFCGGINQLGVSLDYKGTLSVEHLTNLYSIDRLEDTITVELGKMTDNQILHAFKVYLPKLSSYYPDRKIIFK